VNIDSTVLDVLSNATTEGNSLKLTGKLDRPLYVATNKVLEAAGGKWNRKAQAHLFDGDAAEIMDAIILTGKVTNKKQELGFFPTPRAIVERMIEAAQIEFAMSVLEPSSGKGAIVWELVKITPTIQCYEIDPSNAAEMLTHVNVPVIVADFLTVEPTQTFDRVVMNPPFAKQDDIRHVNHAMRFLKPGGRLVAIMAAGVTFRTNHLTFAFRHFLSAHKGTIEALPQDSFAESGTGVNTVMVTIDRP
jgi:predicted RNA methylase